MASKSGHQSDEMASESGHESDEMSVDSDDSDFYGEEKPSPPSISEALNAPRTGDDETTSDLTSRVEELDTDKYWEDRKSTALVPRSPQREPKREPNISHLHNPYEGYHYAWQLTESIETFLERLPPSTTPTDVDVPWIYMCNPHVQRKPKSAALNQMSKGNEDEGTEELWCDFRCATEGGTARLHMLSGHTKEVIQTAGLSPAVQKGIDAIKKEAVHDILDLSWRCKVRTGKVR
ncbi:DUF1917 domain-containing protein [Candidatus Bathyarchaeota archaeon]|nr:DUF1917 domain-containing protein [Candidatus Bathyarchaeota archaeon]